MVRSALTTIQLCFSQNEEDRTDSVVPAVVAESPVWRWASDEIEYADAIHPQRSYFQSVFALPLRSLPEGSSCCSASIRSVSAVMKEGGK